MPSLASLIKALKLREIPATHQVIPRKSVADQRIERKLAEKRVKTGKKVCITFVHNDVDPILNNLLGLQKIPKTDYQCNYWAIWLDFSRLVTIQGTRLPDREVFTYLLRIKGWRDQYLRVVVQGGPQPEPIRWGCLKATLFHINEIGRHP